MKTLKCTKDDESYELTYKDDDPNYEPDRRQLILAGWDVEEKEDTR